MDIADDLKSETALSATITGRGTPGKYRGARINGISDQAM